MKLFLKKLWNIITSLLVVVVLFFTFSLIGPKLTGMEMYVVMSGSMEPTYKTGSVIYVRESETIEINDVVTFQLNENTVATHRIINETKDENGKLAYVTKGDANENEDANLLYPENIIGKAVFTIPYLGYVISYIQQPPGLYVAIALGVSVVLMMILSDLLFEEDDKVITEENSVHIKKGGREK